MFVDVRCSLLPISVWQAAVKRRVTAMAVRPAPESGRATVIGRAKFDLVPASWGRGPVYGVSRQWPHGPRHQPGPHPSAALAGPVAINDDPMTRAPATARPIREFNIFKFPFLFFIGPDGKHEAVPSRYARRADVVVWAARHDKYWFDMAP